MKKICILQNSMTMGGTDTFVINLCRGLVRDGYEVTVVLSVDADRKLPREKELLDSGASILKTCSFRGGLSSRIRHFKMLYSILKKGKFDAFQTNIDLFNGPQLAVAWLAGVPIRVCHSHNAQQAREVDKGRTFSVSAYQKIMRWLCWKFSNRRCGCSELAMHFLYKDRWKEDHNSHIVHNGIDLNKYQCGEFDIEKKKHEIGVNKKYVICTVGRITSQKNPEFLLEVFDKLAGMRNDVDLAWCGSGEKENDIREKIVAYGIEDRVHLLGNRSDIPDVLSCSNVFFLPSKFEGLGIVLIEAQAAKLPCVISDSIPKEVDCGLCISVSLSDTSQTWADYINKILSGEINLRLDVEKLNKYSCDYMIKEMEEVFEG